MKSNAWIAVFLAALLAAPLAHAQLYRWVDKEGKVRYTDTPPPAGVKSSSIKAPAAPEAAKPAAKAASKDAAKDAKKDAKAEKEDPVEKEKQAATFREYCGRAKGELATLESGQRISRTDEKGERYFLDDSQRAQEVAKARASVSEWCK